MSGAGSPAINENVWRQALGEKWKVWDSTDCRTLTDGGVPRCNEFWFNASTGGTSRAVAIAGTSSGAQSARAILRRGARGAHFRSIWGRDAIGKTRDQPSDTNSMEQVCLQRWTGGSVCDPTVGGKDSFCGRIGSCDTLCVGPNSDIRGFLDAGNTAALASYSVHFTEPCIAGELMLGKRAEMMGAYIAAGFGCFFGLFAVMCLCSRLRNWLRRKNSYRMWLARNGTQQPQFPGPQSFMMPAQNGCIR